MKRRALGASGIEVSAIGLGCWGMSGSYGPADEGESIGTAHHAPELGGDRPDNAGLHGGAAPARLPHHGPSTAALHHALGLGVYLIDTADSYGDDGHNESLIGYALV